MNVKQGFFANGQFVEVSDAQAQLDENLFSSVFQNICNSLLLKEWEAVRGWFEIYHESKMSIERIESYSWEKSKGYKTVRKVERFLKIHIEFHGKIFTLDHVAFNYYSDTYKFAAEILKAVADPYGWRRYCEVNARREYFGPKKPIPKNVLC